jgi:hypothetical protein
MIFLERDSELAPWIYGIIHGEPTPAGDFLKSLADAAARADPENYNSMRPGLLEIQKRYPKYRCTDWR